MSAIKPKDFLVILLIIAQAQKVTGKDITDFDWSDLDEILLDPTILGYIKLLVG